MARIPISWSQNLLFVLTRETCTHLLSAVQAVTAWCEQAVPFGALLAIIFLRQHIVGEVTSAFLPSIFAWSWHGICYKTANGDGWCTGIVIMVYLTSCIHKFNGVMRKEVALKEESSRWVCWALAAFAAFQAAGTVLLLYQQQLWTNFYLMPGGVDGVSFTSCPFGLPMWTQNRLINRL